MIDDIDIIDGHVHCFLREHLDKIRIEPRMNADERRSKQMQ